MRHQTSRWPLLLILFVTLLTSFAASQTSIRITGVNGSSLQKAAVEIARESTLSGEINAGDLASGKWLLQIAWRRSGEDTWWMSASKQLLDLEKDRKLRWQIEGVAIGTQFDDRAEVEIIAILTAVSGPLPEGVIDYRSLVYLCKAISKPVLATRKSRTLSTLKVTPRIRIEHIAEAQFRRGEIYEVGLREIFSGKFRKPTLSLIRLVVQPLNSESYYVMEDEPLLREGDWSARVEFVSDDFDQYTEFTVFAVITRRELPLGRAIAQDYWRQLLHRDVIAVSPIVRVTRVEVPTTANQIALRILTIDATAVDTQKRWEVRPKAGVRGMLIGRPLKEKEGIWVLATHEFEGDQWRIVGKASIRNKRFWEVTPQKLGNPGEYLKMLALVAESADGALDASRIENAAAYSRPVHILTSDEPPVTLTIQSINNREVRNFYTRKTGLSVERVSEIRGAVAGRALEADDKIWLLAMEEDSDSPWQLLGQANLTSKHRWAMPPVALGDTGDELFLLAVVSKGRVTEMSIEEQGNIIASSDRVLIKLVD